jgi:hypothetical protein
MISRLCLYIGLNAARLYFVYVNVRTVVLSTLSRPHASLLVAAARLPHVTRFYGSASARPVS